MMIEFEFEDVQASFFHWCYCEGALGYGDGVGVEWLRNASQNTLHNCVRENFAVIIASLTPRDSFCAVLCVRVCV